MINLNPFVCGGAAFLDDDEIHGRRGSSRSAGSSPRSKSRRSSFNKRGHHNKNPYSTRGLDKFSELLADLEAKRQQIYTQISPENISFVRFVYPDSQDCVPIVVKLKESDRKNHKINPMYRKSMSLQQHYSAPLEKERSTEQRSLDTERTIKMKRFLSSMDLTMGWLTRPAYYVPMVVIMILMIFTVLGRSVAIMCTSFAWYLVPMMRAPQNVSSSIKTKKKVLARRFSENIKMKTKTEISPRKIGTRYSSNQNEGYRKFG